MDHLNISSLFSPIDNLTSINTSTLVSHNLSLTIEWRIACIILRTFAVFANLALLIAVYIDRTSKAGPRLLIGNLALCSLGLCACIFPVLSAQEWLPPGSISSPCSIVSASFFFMTVISWADVCLAINRTVAICFPYYYDTFRGRKVTWTLIGFSWCLSIVAAILIATETGVTFVNTDGRFCSLKVTSGFGEFYTAFCAVFPYLSIGIASACIFITAHLRLRHPPVNAADATRIKRLVTRRLVIAKAMSVSLLWSLLCTVPILIVASVSPDFIYNNKWINLLVTLSIILLYAINPVIYLWISPAYRQCLLRAARCLTNHRSANVEPTNVSRNQHSRTRYD